MKCKNKELFKLRKKLLNYNKKLIHNEYIFFKILGCDTKSLRWGDCLQERLEEKHVLILHMCILQQWNICPIGQSQDLKLNIQIYR